MMFIDARLPLRFAKMEDRAPDEAVLTDGTAAVAPPSVMFDMGSGNADAGHMTDCLCCTPRSAAALALAALFRERAMGQGRPFRAVLAVVGPNGEAAIRAALADDPVASGRFRLA